MKRCLLTIFYVSSFLFSEGQIWTTTKSDSLFFKRNDTLFLKKSQMPFNGALIQETQKQVFYLNGIAVEDSSSFYKSENINYLTDLILPLEKDTFVIDSRYKINRETFKTKKLFFLQSIVGKSRIIDSDTLKAIRYSEINIPDPEYYKAFEQTKTCPISRHKDNLIPYVWGLPTKKGLDLAKNKKVILKGCVGNCDGGQLYYCKIHKFDF